MMSNAERITPVILSGGSGTRLWPLSTQDKPKQFLNLVGPVSMFQKTLGRCQDRDIYDNPIIVGNARHADLIKEQMDEIGVAPAAIILEPCARNTAPAIALAALVMDKPQNAMLVMPSDHVITKPDVFNRAVASSLPIAKARWLVTFGIEPTGPETGYGYVEQGEEIIGSENSFSAKRFVEKPNLENAEKMITQGGYHWNAGVFLFRADVYLEALEGYAPEMLSASRQAMDKAIREDNLVRPDETSFANAPSDSIDYTVMEKAGKVAVTPVNPGWSDVGSWDSLFEIGIGDESGNVLTGDILPLESNNNLIHSDGLSISTYGVEDLIIIANDKKIMILPRGQSQNVKKIVEQSKDQE